MTTNEQKVEIFRKIIHQELKADEYMIELKKQLAVMYQETFALSRRLAQQQRSRYPDKESARKLQQDLEEYNSQLNILNQNIKTYTILYERSRGIQNLSN